MSGTPQRANLQLLLAAIAFLAGVVILVVRFGSSAPESAALPTPLPIATAVRRATDIPPTTAPPAGENLGAPTQTATAALPGTPVTLPIVQAPVTSPAPTLTAVTTIIIPTLPLAPATVVPLTPTNTIAAPVVPVTALATITPSPTLTAASGASAAPSATSAARVTSTPSATVRVTTSPSATSSAPTATPGASMTPTATPDEGVRTLVFLVDGTQPKAEILYEINGQEFIAGNVGEVGLPWTITVQVLIGSDARILADGIEENGDLRCQITGDLVPTPGIIDYDPNPYPQVECLLLVP